RQKQKRRAALHCWNRKDHARKKPDKKELAQMKVMSDLGASPTAIAQKLGRSHHTVIKYLESDVYNDSTISVIVEKIKENEINDLYVLGAKARKNLHTS